MIITPEMAERIRAQGRKVVQTEAEALKRLPDRIGEPFVAAAPAILERCNEAERGRLIVSGMGKPGFIAQKISATFASTGIPSFALHPADALHGDLGRVGNKDVVLLLSNSGATQEMVELLNPLKRTQAILVVMTAKKESPLAQHADVLLDLGEVIEACPLGLAPTTSSTVMLALGDALAMACLEVRDFDSKDFAQYHPGGSLGRQLMTVTEVMRKDKSLPVVLPDASLEQTLDVMTSTVGRPGAACVIAPNSGELLGLFTDGDLRRLLTNGQATLAMDTTAVELMTPKPITILENKLASEAARIMSEKHLDQLPVVDEANKAVGLIDIQDLLELGFTP